MLSNITDRLPEFARRLSFRLLFVLFLIGSVLMYATIYILQMEVEEEDKQLIAEETICVEGETVYDQETVSLLRDWFLLAPPLDKLDNLHDEDIAVKPSRTEAVIVDILGGMRDGFFMESGAGASERTTNTLMLERNLNWTGVILQDDSELYAQLVSKRRRAVLSHTCLSATTCPLKMAMQSGNTARLNGNNASESSSLGSEEAQCFSLYYFILALNTAGLDYLSLGIDSNYVLKILKTVPWDKVNILTISVRPSVDSQVTLALLDYLTQQGYYLHSSCVIDGTAPDHDVIFVKKM